MVRHRTLGTEACPVVFNGRDDKLLRDVVVVPGAWATFVLREFLCLDDGDLWTIFFDGFPSPLGANIAPNSSEVFCLDDGMTDSPVRGVCHCTFCAPMFDAPVLLFDDLSFRQTFVRGRPCAFIVGEEHVSLSLLRIALCYNHTCYSLQC